MDISCEALRARALGALGKVLAAQGSLARGFFRYVNVMPIPKARRRSVRRVSRTVPYFRVVFHVILLETLIITCGGVQADGLKLCGKRRAKLFCLGVGMKIRNEVLHRADYTAELLA